MPKTIQWSIMLICMLVTSAAYTQSDIKKYVQQSMTKIEHLSIDSANDDDLQAFGQAIGDARIVLMGEQDHGDATSFEAKTRLIKYLNEKKGFEVLLFESDFFGLTEGIQPFYADDQQSDSAYNRFLESNIFEVWTRCHGCKPLFRQLLPALRRSERNLMVGGFDCRQIFRYSRANLARQLDSLLRLYKVPIVNQGNYASEILPLVDSVLYSSRQAKDTTIYYAAATYLHTIKDGLKDKIAPDAFWSMVIDNLIADNLNNQGFDRAIRSGKPWLGYESSNIRDAQMAKNLQWLCTNRYPSKKIIVWAASGHIIKQTEPTHNKSVDRIKRMGTIFRELYANPNELYYLGFASLQGQTSRLITPTINIPAKKKNSFETWPSADIAYGFVDFKKLNENTTSASAPFTATLLAHNYGIKARWNKMFDGIFFIRNMEACKLYF